MNELSKYIGEINGLCVTNNVKALFAFGSVVTKNFTASSDIDLVVDIDDNDPLTYSEKYFNLKFQLEQLLKRPIDLLEQKTIKNPFLKKQIDETKVLVYGK